MKLLKIVLIALVTVGIYSFTTNPMTKKEDVNSLKEITQQKQLRIYFIPGLTPQQRRTGRNAVECMYGINLQRLVESNEAYETWTYLSPTGTTAGHAGATGTDEGVPPTNCAGSEYISVQFNFDPNTPTFTFN
ncbi:hypothetical protein ACOSP6_03460 [Tenacibaculum sp. MEBiC06402]|uniref:hypothetical protein n=1 Tax=unclassified Tenacibaculum TaxID=2635139 RepID=UPI003B9C5360